MPRFEVEPYLDVRSFDFHPDSDIVELVASPLDTIEGISLWKAATACDYTPAILNKNFRMKMYVESNDWHIRLIAKHQIGVA